MRNNKKCYKCGGEIALIKKGYVLKNFSHIKTVKTNWDSSVSVNFDADYCLMCLYESIKQLAKQIMPFTKLELELIKEGKKKTSLRSAIPKYSKYPFEKVRVTIYCKTILFHDYQKECEDYFNVEKSIDNSIVISEGFKTFDELIITLKKKGFKLPKEMWLYDLRKPIKI